MIQNFEQVGAINGKMTAYNCEMFTDHLKWKRGADVSVSPNSDELSYFEK